MEGKYGNALARQCILNKSKTVITGMVTNTIDTIIFNEYGRDGSNREAVRE
jgi:hypothetical protein